ncbi:hypothetical protein FNA46_16240 [Rhizobium straminoryzae]|uniref:DUF2628 domain-containing protein n=2 Tax=Rhizobium straminoryzae TaxID=1387186 RepID=A0A549T583_9HYPH|nr:hypothetical protein [Rhizobium sp. RU35A]TRL37002.1 hypothetical protein FNA46_16240 [Rhizobium straminoryzae]
MAKAIQLMHSRSGLSRTGYYGFSWTSLVFGGVPAIFRGDLVMGASVCVAGGIAALLVGVIGLGLPGLLVGWLAVGAGWGMVYNRIYTKRLIERGYRFADTDQRNAEAQRAVGMDGMPVASRAGG